MTVTPGAEKVFPAGQAGGAPAAPPAAAGKTPAGGSGGGSSSGGGMKLPKLDRKTLMWGGAAAVALIAFVSTRAGGDDLEEDEEGMTIEPAELDTSEEDLYNSLQPEIENVADLVTDMRDNPAPQKPTKVTVKAPQGNNTKTVRRLYRVKKRDRKGPNDLSNIAKKFGVKRKTLWRLNRKIIERRFPGKRTSKRGRRIKKGTPLVIPKK